MSKPSLHERSFLVGLQRQGIERSTVDESLQELAQLVESAGGEALDCIVQKLERPTAPYYIGKGKAHEIAELAKESNIVSVIFDDELSPAQSRNLEKVLGRKVIDRTQLILDIFALRAKSREGKIQIELAQLQYLLPRLTRMWTHLSRQTGGIGTRGPGETQLEVDRRRVLEKIARLKRELAEVRKHRATQREGRNRSHWPLCALVGYTNAGKSTLMNRLTQADVYAADQLFATLDPTIRHFTLRNDQTVLLSDTVGFLKKLPHHLVESFRATLEEVNEADVLIHVVDATHPNFDMQMRAVEEVLTQIKAHEKVTLTVFNKVDELSPENTAMLRQHLQQTPKSVALSALTGQGVDELLFELERIFSSWRKTMRLKIPQSQAALIAELHRDGQVLERTYEEDFVILEVQVPSHMQGKLKEYHANPRNARQRKTTRKTVENGG